LLITGERVDGRLSLQLDRGPNAAAKARGGLASLGDDLDGSLLETLQLLVTEVVTNSVRHARADTVLLSVLVGDSTVRAEVTDHGPGFDPARVGPLSSAHTGWGLFLVERLADGWGVNKDRDGTRVWFELHRA
jgi:anti-sigma regulatory factor (Ser/Thr protein kinase)